MPDNDAASTTKLMDLLRMCTLNTHHTLILCRGPFSLTEPPGISEGVLANCILLVGTSSVKSEGGARSEAIEVTRVQSQVSFFILTECKRKCGFLLGQLPVTFYNIGLLHLHCLPIPGSILLVWTLSSRPGGFQGHSNKRSTFSQH